MKIGIQLAELILNVTKMFAVNKLQIKKHLKHTPSICSTCKSKHMKYSPITINGAVLNPNSSAPSIAATTTSKPVRNWPSAWTTTLK